MFLSNFFLAKLIKAIKNVNVNRGLQKKFKIFSLHK